MKRDATDRLIKLADQLSTVLGDVAVPDELVVLVRELKAARQEAAKFRGNAPECPTCKAYKVAQEKAWSAERDVNYKIDRLIDAMVDGP